MEILESRELLSVHPLGYDIGTDYVQTGAAQQFQTEGTEILSEYTDQAKYTSVTFEFVNDNFPALVSAGHLLINKTYTLQYRAATTGTWAQVNSLSVLIEEEGLPVIVGLDEEPTVLNGLTAGTTYEFRLVDLVTNNNSDDSTKSTAALNAAHAGSAYEIGTISTVAPSNAELFKTRYNPGTEGDGELVLTLFGLPEGYEDTDILVTASFGITGTEKPIKPENILIYPDAVGNFVIVIQEISDNDKINIEKINVGNGDAILFTDTVFTASLKTEAPSTNSTSSASNITSSAVTLTWTKPTQALTTAGTFVKADPVKYNKTVQETDYKITIVGIDDDSKRVVYYSSGKTTLAMTDFGFDFQYQYLYKIEVKMETKVTGVTLDTDDWGYVVVSSGVFELKDLGLGSGMAVGQPTDVKTAPTDSNVKITWKAPANYIGSYEVTIKNRTTDDASGFFTVATGAKTEAIIAIDNSNEVLVDGNLSAWKLKKGDRYEVVIMPTSGNSDGSNGLSSTPTHFIAAKTQTDPAPTEIASVPANAPAADLFEIKKGNITGTIIVRLNHENSTYFHDRLIPKDVDGYWIRLGDRVYITKEDAFDGYTFFAPGLTNVEVHINAANAAGIETKGTTYTATVPPDSFSVLTDQTVASALNVTGTVSGNKITVAWANNNAAINNSDNGYYAFEYDIYISQSKTGHWRWVDNKYVDFSEPNNLKVELDVYGYDGEFQYDTDYFVAVIARCRNDNAVGVKFAAMTASATAFRIPAVDKANILTAKKVEHIALDENGNIEFTPIDNWTSGSKKLPTQYYVVLRDANKAVLTGDFVSVASAYRGVTLTPPTHLTPKGKYTIEVYGVIGSSAFAIIGSAKATGTFTVPDYTGATIKAGKPTVNSVSITVTDKNQSFLVEKFYYLEYTNIVDAKGKPDWNTAAVEKVTATIWGDSYDLKAKLDPNTQYYMRIVTADVDAATSDTYYGSWGSSAGWRNAKNVALGKEIKIKTAAVPLAVISKSGLSFNTESFGMTLKSVGQTMLAGKGTDALFGTDKPFSGAIFYFSLLVSLDSKVDKATGHLIGALEVELDDCNIQLENLIPKSGSPIVDGQYTLEYALTGVDGIFDKLNVSAVNVANVKNLSFQLLTTVRYNTGIFESVTKPGKIAMPKWFV
jgi:hypothetical protein